MVQKESGRSLGLRGHSKSVESHMWGGVCTCVCVCGGGGGGGRVGGGDVSVGEYCLVYPLGNLVGTSSEGHSKSIESHL